MKIVRVEAFSYQLGYKFGTFEMSQGRTVSKVPSLVVKVTTDDGLIGWGETCTLGTAHLQAYFESEVAAIAVVGKCVLGLDPRQAGVVQATMAKHLISGMGAKSTIDIACWDILGKAAGLPVSSLLGGRQQERFKLWDSIALGPPRVMAESVKKALAAGWTDFQIKVGNDPYEDAERVAAVVAEVRPENLVVADANGGWNLQNALIAAREMAGSRIFLEQPCKSISNCAEVRRRSDLPMILDESIVSVEDVITAKSFVRAGGVSIKPSKVGGLTAARLMRDTATELGMMVTIDDAWGGALITAVLAHLAISTKPDALMATSFMTNWTAPMIANGPLRDKAGFGTAPAGPGLGVEVDEDQLGAPILTIR